MTFSEVNIKPLFPTPFVVASLPPEMSADLDHRLTPMLLEKSKTMPSAHITNVGGWQSDTRITEWGGEPVRVVVDALRGLIKEITLDIHRPNFQCDIDWKVYGWANINRKGNLNVVHTHPGAYWSAVYYVHIDEPEDADVGGEFQVVDPRGTLPIIYCPQLRLGMEGFLSCGGHELHKPKVGQCLLLPSWLPHAVMPYTGEGMRISLALNFSV